MLNIAISNIKNYNRFYYKTTNIKESKKKIKLKRTIDNDR